MSLPTPKLAKHSVLKLRHLLALSISALACGLVALVLLTVGKAGTARVETEIGSSLMIIADQMQDKLDRALFERYREIGSAARLMQSLGVTERPDALAIWLNELKESNADYVWLAFADRTGRVVRASGRLHEGSDVSNRPWFSAGMKSETVGDVHESELLASLPTRRAGGPIRVLDLAAPVKAKDGSTAGVLIAQLDWSWAVEVRDSLFGNTPLTRTAEVLVLARDGSVLLGPPGLNGQRLSLASFPRAMTGETLFAVDKWPDGQSYVTGYARSDGHRSYSGLGWIVLVRQDAKLALAPVRRLQHDAVLWSIAIAGLASVLAWILSGRIAGPILRLASSAERIRRGEEARIPALTDYPEVATLSRSLDTLVSDLKARREALEELNHSLEAQVSQRTSQLAARNEALDRAREEAERATAAKSRFLAAASHDLRQPLHAMTLFARALSRRVNGQDAVRLVAQLEASLASLKQMFDALLNVSRLDAGLIQPKQSTIELHKLIAQLVPDFRANANARGLRLRVRNRHALVHTDPALLESMIRNLVANALKFTRTGGVLLALRQRGGKLRIEVWDTGPGISPAREQRIFEEFVRSSEQATGSNEGLGLGLSIVRRYADLLGIGVEVKSRLGRGSCLSLTLEPATAQQSARLKSSDPVQRFEPSLQGARILLVDDDPAILDAMSRELADRGCIPLPHADASEAASELERGLAVDAAVVDYNLSQEVTGPSLLAAAEKTRGARIPALILTGGTDAATLSAILLSGRPWLTKPASPDAIARALQDLIAAPQLKTRAVSHAPEPAPSHAG